MVQWFIIFSTLLVIYRNTFVWLFQRWGAADSYYSHGYLILPLVIYLVWRQRDCFREAKDDGKAVGLILLGSGLMLHLVSRWSGVFFISAFSIIPVVFGLVLSCYGRCAARRLLFPVGFLVSMIPLPLVAIVRLSFLLKIWSAQWAIHWVHAVGLSAVQDGSFIHMAHSTLLVGDVCSGLRSLVALLTLGALFAYFFQAAWWRRAALFLSAAPIALVVNTARIAFLCFVAEVYGEEWAHGSVHDVSGLLIFALSFVLLAISREVLE